MPISKRRRKLQIAHLKTLNTCLQILPMLLVLDQLLV